MTIKRSFGVGIAVIILLNLLVIGSEVLIYKKVNDASRARDDISAFKDVFNNKVMEHGVWADKLTEHVMDGWPFERGLDFKKDPILIWLNKMGIRHGHDHEKEMIRYINLHVEDQYKVASKIVKTEGLEDKRAIYMDEFMVAVQNLKPQAGMFLNHLNKEMVEMNKSLERLENMNRYFKIITSSFIILIILVFFLALDVTAIKPLSSISKSIENVSKGDLSQKLEHLKKNEIGQISSSFNTMIDSIVGIINGINNASDSIMSGVEKVKEQATRSSQASKSQAEKATQIASTSEQMSQTIIDIAGNAATASTSSGKAMELAKSGREAAIETKKIEEKVFNSTVNLSTMMDKLSNKAGEISNIVNVINDIADQTNLLALNAAIEAARAGEQGRGFGVVADEVRKLAERTLKATSEISGNISDVLTEIKATTQSMEEVTTEVTTVTKGINNLEGMLGDIVHAIEDATDRVNQIASAVEQQSSATEHVAIEIEESSKLSQDIENMASEVLGQINSLTSVAEDLKNSINRFNV